MKRTSTIWYLIALLLFLGGWMAATPILAAPWQDLKTASVTNFEGGKKIDVTDRGLAIFTDFEQERDVMCRSNPAKALTIQGARLDLVNDGGDRKWYLLSTTVDAKPGSYAVACTPKDQALDTADYGYAELPSWSAEKRNGLGIGILASTAAAILAAWTYRGRRTALKLLSHESS